jgi:hypothetical protein
MQPVSNELAQFIRQLITPFKNEILNTKRELSALKQAFQTRPRTVTEEIDAIPGRRIFYTLSQVQAFSIAQLGARADAMNYLVSQDGPFVMTHYPLAMWKPSAPAPAATRLGMWRPVAHWPLPDQVLDDDIIDLSYEFFDGGSQRAEQNLAVPAGLLSRPDNLIPLPVPSLFTPNTVMQIFPTYEDIDFSSAGTPTTDGKLVIALPGYRIVNM